MSCMLYHCHEALLASEVIVEHTHMLIFHHRSNFQCSASSKLARVFIFSSL